MPKIITDYSKTLIYKIVSKNLNITDCYVGHTTNFRQRKNKHKSSCNNKNCKSFNCNIYNFIRQNEGWSNWEMIEIEKYPCSDKREATARERTHYELLNSSLNSYKPFTTDDEKRENKKQYYEINTNKIKANKKQYYQNNETKLLNYQKQYNEINTNKIKVYKKCYYQKNKEKARQYYQKNKEKIKNYQKNKNKTICDCVE